MRALLIAALVLLTGCAANSSRRSSVQPDQDVARQHEYRGESPSGRKSSRNQSALRETSFNNRFGRWRKITVDMWIPNKGDLK